MPSFDETTVNFMKEVLSGRKKLIRLKDLIPVNVPRLTEFQADRLYEQSMKNMLIRQHLPEPPTDSVRRPVGRKFLFNV